MLVGIGLLILLAVTILGAFSVIPIAWAIIVIFLVLAAMMFTGKMPTLIALPLMAILIGFVAQMPFMGKDSILTLVIDSGSMRLASTIAAVIFGAWMGQVLNQTGISTTIIKKAAELGGDRPIPVAIAMAAAVAILFTTLGGLGAVIMIGTIVLPILISVGIKPVQAAGIMLLGFATGLELNLTNWAYFLQLTKVSRDDMIVFALILVVVTALATLLFIFRELGGGKATVTGWAAESKEIAAAKEKLAQAQAPWYSLIAPLVPVVLILQPNIVDLFRGPAEWKWSVPIVAALIIGLLYAAITTKPKELLTLLPKTAYAGLQDGAPAILLMVSIGMVLNAVLSPQVAKPMGEMLKNVIPTSQIPYMIFFALMAILALYRGPMNMFGLGSGIVGLIILSNLLTPLATVAGFMCAERVQSAGDPTNTHNVWVASFVGEDVNKVTFKLIPYLWGIAAIGAVVAGLMYMR
jgi:H+/gluconate symporter-like permease